MQAKPSSRCPPNTGWPQCSFPYIHQISFTCFRNGSVPFFMDYRTRAIVCKITPETARSPIHVVVSMEQGSQVKEEGGEEREEKYPNQRQFVAWVINAMGAAK
jgi:hypothetical protein